MTKPSTFLQGGYDGKGQKRRTMKQKREVATVNKDGHEPKRDVAQRKCVHSARNSQCLSNILVSIRKNILLFQIIVTSLH